MAIYQLGDLAPRIDPTAFIFDSADIIGDVIVREHASIWSNVSIRGDNTVIDIGHLSLPTTSQSVIRRCCTAVKLVLVH
jgi:carbonic anhydrase/acetyltransferase-like protein (isoleucine patch superfamily)